MAPKQENSPSPSKTVKRDDHHSRSSPQHAILRGSMLALVRMPRGEDMLRAMHVWPAMDSREAPSPRVAGLRWAADRTAVSKEANKALDASFGPGTANAYRKLQKMKYPMVRKFIEHGFLRLFDCSGAVSLIQLHGKDVALALAEAIKNGDVEGETSELFAFLLRQSKGRHIEAKSKLEALEVGKPDTDSDATEEVVDEVEHL